MPFINSRVSLTMTDTQKEAVKEKLGQAISIIPGKSETWLMLEFADNCDLYFQGNQTSPTAFIEVKVFGSIQKEYSEQLTQAICDIYETELNIEKNRIYVKYEETDMWGWNGKNF